MSRTIQESPFKTAVRNQPAAAPPEAAYLRSVSVEERATADEEEEFREEDFDDDFDDDFEEDLDDDLKEFEDEIDDPTGNDDGDDDEDVAEPFEEEDDF